MKNLNLNIHGLLIYILMVTSGCSQSGNLNFSCKSWKLDRPYAYIIEDDNEYRFTFGDILVDTETPLIGCPDSPHLNKHTATYLKDILKLSDLENAEILFYAPRMGTVFVLLPNDKDNVRPVSISYDLNGPRPKPGTLWVRPDDDDNWNRKEDEMHTNIYRNKRKGLIAIVDKFNYGDTPIARIQVIQSRTKRMRKNFPDYEVLSYWADINRTETLEPLSYWINTHREVSFDNYKLGLEQKNKLHPESPFLLKADSCIRLLDYENALRYYQEAFSLCSGKVRSDKYLSAAIAAAQSNNDSIAINYIQKAQSIDPDWISELIPITELLEDLRLLPEWESIFIENENRTMRIHPEYDRGLRSKLLKIYRTDQNSRGHLLKEAREEHPDEEKIRELWKEVQLIDSINLQSVIELLDNYGWISGDVAGDSNQALFFVIQHASPDIIQKYIPIFEQAAKNQELPLDLFAKMYDRNQMYSGKPQRYGTQRVQKSTGCRKMVLWKLEDPDKVNIWRAEMGLPPLSLTEIDDI